MPLNYTLTTGQLDVPQSQKLDTHLTCAILHTQQSSCRPEEAKSTAQLGRGMAGSSSCGDVGVGSSCGCDHLHRRGT